jgi:hypothetical protein
VQLSLLSVPIPSEAHLLTSPSFQRFQTVTDLFQSHTPLIHEVIPALEGLEAAFVQVRDSVNKDLPNVIRAAAHAALEVIAKYYSLSDDCTVLAMAMGE